MIAVQFGSGNASGKAVGLRMDLLWENDSPSSSFSAQTVTVDLSGYAQFMVVPIFSSSTRNLCPPVISAVEDGVVSGMVCGSGSGDHVGSRTCYYDSSVPGIVFAGGNYSGASNNAYCIPMFIYGIRTGSGTSTGSGGGGGGGGGVTSVNGMTGAVILDAADVSAVPAGEGVPAGGTSGQYLAKASNDDHDLVWTSGGGGGSSDYGDLTNKPSIESVTLSGNKTAGDLGLAKATDIPAAYTSNPAALGTASPGSSTAWARGDHVHAKPTYSKSDVGLGNVDNVQQYSANNPPPYPVTSVNGSTGDVSLSIPASAADVGAIAAPASPSVGDFLVYTSNGWAAQSLSTWQGGSY